MQLNLLDVFQLCTYLQFKSLTLSITIVNINSPPLHGSLFATHFNSIFNLSDCFTSLRIATSAMVKCYSSEETISMTCTAGAVQRKPLIEIENLFVTDLYFTKANCRFLLLCISFTPLHTTFWCIWLNDNYVII
jgi:hypothetical protein